MPTRSKPGARPGHTRFDADRLTQARTLCERATQSGEIPGLALVVARHGRVLLDAAWGSRDASGNRPATPDTVWLIASVTKPVVCAGIGLLLERGALTLDDPVQRFIPELEGQDRAGITLRHLLTHTSGLPDMLPENTKLRQQHAPLRDFVRQICATPLLFSPGTEIRYQSTGIALLGEIIERVAEVPCRSFLQEEFFGPLGMESSALGWRPELADRVAECALPTGTTATDWDWNSAYWRNFGAPWGGMFATARDIATFMQMFMNGGVWKGRRYLGRATVAASHRNQSGALPTLPDAVKATGAWGLGWQLAAPVRRDYYFGDLSSPSTYGHLGATGTAAWNDPESGVTMVLLTNRPECWRFIGTISN
ncbi:MAG: serine hydrolase domain-containing protein, partial [Actinomycetota bacterium]